jgi:hypothetical protein
VQFLREHGPQNPDRPLQARSVPEVATDVRGDPPYVVTLNVGGRADAEAVASALASYPALLDPMESGALGSHSAFRPKVVVRFDAAGDPMFDATSWRDGLPRLRPERLRVTPPGGVGPKVDGTALLLDPSPPPANGVPPESRARQLAILQEQLTVLERLGVLESTSDNGRTRYRLVDPSHQAIVERSLTVHPALVPLVVERGPELDLESPEVADWMLRFRFGTFYSGSSPDR